MAIVRLTTSLSTHLMGVLVDLSGKLLVDELKSYSFESSGPFERKWTFENQSEVIIFLADQCAPMLAREKR